MNQHIYRSLILIFVLSRIIISLAFTDRTVKSDSITYTGLAVNIENNGRFASIQPETETSPGEGFRLDSLYASLGEIRRPHERLLPFQWLHVLVFMPVLFVWKSLVPIIILNNILFALAGYFFLSPLFESSSPLKKITGWGMYLFFPPFFYLTYQFFSEPLFFLLLGVLVHDVVYRSRMTVWTVISAVGIGLTRPYGIVIVLLIIFFLAIRKEYRMAMPLAGAILFAITIQAGVEKVTPHNTDDTPESISLFQAFYYSNTIHGNGDVDYFGKNPSAEARDSLIARYLEQKITGFTLISGLLPQIKEDPLLYGMNLVNKIGAYFFNIIPNSWVYSGNSYQSTMKRMLWAATNYVFLFLLIGGISSYAHERKLFFWCLLTITSIVHILLIARYRYFMPVIAVGIPMAVEGLFLQAAQYGIGNPKVIHREGEDT